MTQLRCLNRSNKLPRKRDIRGREYGRTQYHLAALNVQIDRKSMPLGFKWPGKEPDPLVTCDSQDCQITPDEEDATVVMRKACGHAFHEACSTKNQVQTSCPVRCPLLKAEVKILECSWNIGLVSKGHSEEEEDHISPTREATQDNNQDDDAPPQHGQGADYYQCPAFSRSIKERASAIKFENPKFQKKKAMALQ